MREWITYIILMNPRLDKLCAKIEKLIDNISLDMDKPAHKCTESIIALDELKIRLTNLRVMYDALNKKLSAEELAVFSVNGDKVKDLNRSALYRLRRRAVNKAALTLEYLGFDEDRFQKEYGSVGEVSYIK